jgi:ABC-type nickel/cobalt efflux system permease component RcnA
MQGDYLAELIRRPDLSPAVVISGLAVALGFGAVHALSPGHGKTLVAAYLVGSRGTFKHAALLGASVTVTHTFSVFLIGLATLFLSSYVVPETIIPLLGAISGLSIVFIGGSLFAKRLRKLQGKHSHDHHHHHGDGHHHHDHDHDHEHGPDTHTHVPEGDVTMGSLIALGASGGLVPCPSAMVLMLTAISLGRTGAGLVLLVAFSLGLAAVLVAIGGMVLYAKSWLPDPKATSERPFFKWVPVVSAAVVTCIGAVLTLTSLGIIHVPI